MRKVSAAPILALIAVLIGGPLKAQDSKQPAAIPRPPLSVLCVPEKAQTRVGSPEILSQTQGVDLRPYLEASVLPLVRANWYRLLSKSAENVGGDAAIQFTLLKDGSVTAVKLSDGAGHASLGNLAIRAVANSGPFPALPAEFGGSSVDLRIPFEFAPVASQFPSGPTGSNLRGSKFSLICTPDEMAKSAVDCLKPPHPTYSPEPEFSAEARKKKSQGTVVLYITVAEDGTVQNACAAQSLGDRLDEKAVEAVRTWKFEPATFNGKPRAAELAVQVDFHLYDDPQSASDPTKAPTPLVGVARSSLTPGPAMEFDGSAQAADPKFGSLEVLSDTRGVNFGPYLQRVVAAVRTNWYNLIPDDAVTKKGNLAIEFAVLPDGRIADMKLVARSGDESLDRAAWNGIRGSDPLQPLPSAFTGPYLALRVRFCYNPDRVPLPVASPAP